MLGDKYFNVDTNDFVIVNEVKYKDTLGLYELIFKRIPNDTIFTENDKLAYKSIMLVTNTHKHSHKANNSKKNKYKNIRKYNSILGKRSSKIQIETGMPRVRKQQIR